MLQCRADHTRHKWTPQVKQEAKEDLQYVCSLRDSLSDVDSVSGNEAEEIINNYSLAGSVENDGEVEEDSDECTLKPQSLFGNQ